MASDLSWAADGVGLGVVSDLMLAEDFALGEGDGAGVGEGSRVGVGLGLGEAVGVGVGSGQL